MEFPDAQWAGGTVGYDLTGGTYTVNSWSYVAAVWDGVAPRLYVDGVDTGAVPTGPGGYKVNTSGNLTLGAYDEGRASYNGLIDETAFYGRALTPAQILAHYAAASNPNPGHYSALVQADGALLYLSNAQVPEPSSVLLMGLGLAPAQAPRLAALDQLQRTVYISGFSKILTPNWRVGFLAAAPALVDRALAAGVTRIVAIGCDIPGSRACLSALRSAVRPS